MPVERAAGGTSLIDVLDRVLDKGIVIDAWVRVSLVGIDLITVEARVVVASIDTYLKYSEAVGQVAPVSQAGDRRQGVRGSRCRERRAPGPAQEPARLPAALLAAGGAAPTPRLSATASRDRRACRGVRVAVERRRRATMRPLAARLRLLEGFLSRTEIADCAQHALQWLGEVARRRAVDLPGPAGRRAGAVRGRRRTGCRRRRVTFTRLARRLEQPAGHARCTHREPRFYPRRALRRRPPPPAVDAVRGRRVSRRPARRVRLRRRSRSACCCSRGAPHARPPSMHWFATVLGQKLDQILRQQALAEGDRKQGRERALLYSIINAVTDPILLTDTEGRLLDRQRARRDAVHRVARRRAKAAAARSR